MTEAETTSTPIPPQGFQPQEPRLAPWNMLPFPMVPWGEPQALARGFSATLHTGASGKSNRTKARPGKGEASAALGALGGQNPAGPQLLVPHHSGTDCSPSAMGPGTLRLTLLG